ncbi:MAG TPA: HWE histidine kinase domain-containing protein, partial [Salinarimonas sp.]|nr:HWE histidine kinase domain-containing protein [Salinarimonas sp.]
FDWSATPLGPMERWPQSLKTTVGILLRSPVPIVLLWGPDGIMIYNEAYSSFAGARHPRLLGSKVREGWPEVADFNDRVMRVGLAGGTLSFRDQELTLRRRGVPEPVWMNLDYSPVLDESGRPAGVLAIVVETTDRVLAERAQDFRLALAERLRDLAAPAAIMAAAAQMLGERLAAACVGYAEADALGEQALVEVDWCAPGFRSVAGTHRLADYGPAMAAALRAGQAVRVADTASDPLTQGVDGAFATLGTRAFLAAPLVRDGQLAGILYALSPHPRAWTDAEAGLVAETAERTWAALRRARAEAGLRASEAHHRTAIDLSPQTSWTAVPDGRLDSVGARWEEWTGTSGLGSSWADAMHPDDLDPSLAAWGRSVTTGEPYDIEHRARMRDGSYRWMHSRAYPRRDEGGAILRWYGTTEDIHDRKQGELHLRLLVNELNHRVKNTLAAVQSIAAQTFRERADAVEARRLFEGRLMALAAAHDVLTRENWEGAELREIVAESVAGHAQEAGRIAMEGPRLRLSPRAALAIAMALYELATNAAKYGALSGPEGRVAIRWRVEDDALAMSWEETDGPPVVPPTRRGFGTRLVASLARELGGESDLDYAPAGLRWTARAPLAEVRAAEG